MTTVKTGELQAAWRKCVRCGEVRWCSNVCIDCLDALHEQHATHPEFWDGSRKMKKPKKPNRDRMLASLAAGGDTNVIATRHGVSEHYIVCLKREMRFRRKPE